MTKFLLLLCIAGSNNFYDSMLPYTYRNDTLYIHYWYSVTASNLKIFLDAVDYYKPKVVVLTVETAGGEPQAAINFIWYIRQHAKLITKSSGLVASAGVLLFLGGDKRIATKYTIFLIHDLRQFTFSFLSPSDSKKQAETLLKIQKVINTFIADRTGLSLAQVDSLSQAETWLTGQEALKFHICTEVRE